MVDSNRKNDISLDILISSAVSHGQESQDIAVAPLIGNKTPSVDKPSDSQVKPSADELSIHNKEGLFVEIENPESVKNEVNTPVEAPEDQKEVEAYKPYNQHTETLPEHHSNGVAKEQSNVQPSTHKTFDNSSTPPSQHFDEFTPGKQLEQKGATSILVDGEKPVSEAIDSQNIEPEQEATPVENIEEDITQEEVIEEENTSPPPGYDPNSIVITGTLGDDTLIGTDDLDVIVGLSGDDLINGSDGNDTIYGGNDNDTISGGLGDDSILGENGADSINGNEGDDIIHGDDGQDTINGGDGNDTIYGGNNNDTISGGVGDDVILGEAGADSIDAGDGNDSIVGGDGNDTIIGGNGNDTAYGGDGIDSITGGNGNDLLVGEAGNDVLLGNNGNDTLVGNIGNDVLSGDNGNDMLYGGDGNDFLQGGYGNDTLNAGNGNDVLFAEYFVAPMDFILLAGGRVNTLNAGDGNDSLYGSTGTDILNGDAGNDVVSANSGNDTLNGGSGIDILAGGNGNDVINGGDGTDLIVGDNHNDTLNGGAGNDWLSGGNGNDKLAGGTGQDTLTGGAGSDVFIFTQIDHSPHATADLITDFVQGTDQIDLTGLGFDGIQAGAPSGSTLGYTITKAGTFISNADSTFVVKLTGEVHLNNSDFIGLNTTHDSGDSGDNSFAGSSYNDIYDGDQGDDTISGGDGNDSLNGGEGDDSLQGGTGNDTLIGDDGEDVVSGGAGNDYLFGSAGDDTVSGGSGNDTINGGNGSDVLTGGQGTDYFNFTSLTESTDSARDTITDFEAGIDLIDLTGLGFTDIQEGAGSGSTLGYTKSGGNTIIEDADSDFSIEVVGEMDLTQNDFVGVGVGGGKVICTELWRQGHMDEIYYKADRVFGRIITRENPTALLGYLYWGIPVVRLMRRSRIVFYLAKWLITPALHEICYQIGVKPKSNFFNAMLLKNIIKVSYYIGKRQRTRRLRRFYQQILQNNC